MTDSKRGESGRGDSQDENDVQHHLNWRVRGRDLISQRGIDFDVSGAFDEIVVYGLFHIETMDDGWVWMSVGDVVLWMRKDADGCVTVNVYRGLDGTVRGVTRLRSDSSEGTDLL